MSLEELLKEPKSSSAWKTQRKLLLRIIFGVSTISIALLAGVFFVTRLKKTNVSEPPPQARHEAREVSLLTELMKLRNEASQLQEEIQDLRNKTSTPGAGGTGGGVPSHQQAPNQNSVRRSYEAGSDRGSIKVFDIDPGDGFTKVNVETKEYYIPTGAIFQARLITPIKTSVSKTFVMAETTREYRMDMNRKIPKGSRLIGRASLNTVLKGVGVEFETLVLPTGIETRVAGMALSRNALPELEGMYFSDDLQNYGTALAFGFLGGFSEASRERETTIFGLQPQANLSNQVLSGISTASFQVAEEILRDIRNRAVEYVVVPAGENIFVALTSRYEMSDKGSKK